MKLNIYKLLIPIIVGLGIFDLLILKDISYLSIRSVFTFLYITFIPGLLIMLTLKIRNINFWENLSYMVGLSIAYLMFGGLAINWLLPIFGYKTPLSLEPILISTNISITILILLAYLKNHMLNIEIKYPNLSFLDYIFLFVPFLFPVLSIFGAIMLNNGGTNTLSLINLSLISLFIFTVGLCKKINQNIFPSSIFLISLSVLLMLSLRGQHIVGSDIMDEYKMFNTTYTNGIWISNFIKHAYYSCLSITVLPTVLSHLIGINNEFIFKVVIQIIFSIVPLTVFNVIKNYIEDKFAFFGSIIFISFPTFVNAMTMHIRQEISFIFFALCVSLFFNLYIKGIKKKILLYTFGIGMVLSHYSTTYVAILILIPTYLSYAIFRFFHFIKNKLLKTKFLESEKFTSNIGLDFLLVICTATVLWYSQINNSSINILDYTKKTIKNLGTIFREDIRKEGSSILDQFSLSYTHLDQEKLLKNNIEKIRLENINKAGYYPKQSYSDYIPKISLQETIPLKITHKLFYYFFLSQEVVKKIHKIFTITGILYLCFLQLKGRNRNLEYTFLCMASLSSLLLFMVLPYLSIDYDLLRAYQQFLVILVYPSILGTTLILKRLPDFISRLGVLFIVVIYFAIYSNLLPQLIGGFEPSIQLNNYGDTYNKYYLHNEEIYSAIWLDKYRSNKKTIYVDIFGNRKINASVSSTVYGVHDIFPENTLIDSYLYLSYTNKIKQITYGRGRGDRIIYNYPIIFVNNTKNKIYSNSKSEIYN